MWVGAGEKNIYIEARLTALDEWLKRACSAREFDSRLGRFLAMPCAERDAFRVDLSTGHLGRVEKHNAVETSKKSNYRYHGDCLHQTVATRLFGNASSTCPEQL